MRLIMAAAAALTMIVGGLTACGETNGTGSVGGTTTQSEAQKHLENAQSKEKEGFHNMETLAAGYKEKVNEKAKRENAGFTADEVTCISTGKLSAECHMTFSNKEEASNKVTISEDGRTFISE